MVRLGIFGGTFDPPHIAHLVLASDARHQLDLDLVLWVVDGACPVFDLPHSLRAKSMAFALNKADLKPVLPPGMDEIPVVAVSAKTGEGIEALEANLEAAATKGLGTTSQSPITRTRHRVELVSTRDALKRFVNHDLDPELAAEELRIAAHHLGRLTGRIDVEEVLGAIFSEFCIGK